MARVGFGDYHFCELCEDAGGAVGVASREAVVDGVDLRADLAGRPPPGSGGRRSRGRRSPRSPCCLHGHRYFRAATRRRRRRPRQTALLCLASRALGCLSKAGEGEGISKEVGWCRERRARTPPSRGGEAPWMGVAVRGEGERSGSEWRK